MSEENPMDDSKQSEPFDLEQALLDPGSVFSSPKEVFAHEALTYEQKVEVLRRWEYDASEAAVAEEEGMPGAEKIPCTRSCQRSTGSPAASTLSTPVRPNTDPCRVCLRNAGRKDRGWRPVERLLLIRSIMGQGLLVSYGAETLIICPTVMVASSQ